MNLSILDKDKQIKHTLREGNKTTNLLVNEAMNTNTTNIFRYSYLPSVMENLRNDLLYQKYPDFQIFDFEGLSR